MCCLLLQNIKVMSMSRDVLEYFAKKNNKKHYFRHETKVNQNKVLSYYGTLRYMSIDMYMLWFYSGMLQDIGKCE